MKTIIIIIALVFAGVAYYFYDAKTKAENEHQTKIASISDEKENEIAQLKGTYAELAANLKKEIEQGQIKIVQLSDRLSVIMVDKILFPSGESEITPEGLKVLDRIGNVLKNAKNKIIRVEGHTDNVQIDKRLQKKYPTNWELSTARATNVVRFLQENIGIEGELLQPIGMSEYHPVASNETSDGRSQNRRIEIALLP
jgi:chemotaxis protein MotB